MKIKLVEQIWKTSTILKESSENGIEKYIISGPFMKAETPNLNKRSYPEHVCNKAILALKPRVLDKQINMLVDHPDWNGTSMTKVGAILLDITEVQPDGYAHYKAQVLDTAVGKDLKVIMDAGGKIGVSTRGYGSSYEGTVEGYGDTKYEIIKDDFELESIDFVDSPSVTTTKDFVQYENDNKKDKGSKTMKTVAELRATYPELVKEIEEAKAEAIVVLETSVKELETKLVDSKTALKTIVDSLKESFSDLFTVVEESDLVAEAKAEIVTIVEAKKAVEAELVEANEAINTSKNEAIETAKTVEIERLKAEDIEFFKIPTFENIFENCLNADEVKAVYDSNKAIVESVKENANTPADTKSKVEDKNDTSTKLDEDNAKRFRVMNSQRLNQGLKAMTIEQYSEKYCK